MNQLLQLKPKNAYKFAIRVIVPIVGLWFAIDLSARLGAELLWFQEVGYLKMYLLRLTTQGVLFFAIFALSFGYLFSNLNLAQRLKYDRSSDDRSLGQPYQGAIKLRWLLPLTVGLVVWQVFYWCTTGRPCSVSGILILINLQVPQPCLLCSEP